MTFPALPSLPTWIPAACLQGYWYTCSGLICFPGMNNLNAGPRLPLVSVSERQCVLSPAALPWRPSPPPAGALSPNPIAWPGGPLVSWAPQGQGSGAQLSPRLTRSNLRKEAHGVVLCHHRSWLPEGRNEFQNKRKKKYP